MELIFSDAAGKWIEASAVSRELVTEAFHASTRLEDAEFHGRAVRRGFVGFQMS
jgi:hypothetical protein